MNESPLVDMVLGHHDGTLVLIDFVAISEALQVLDFQDISQHFQEFDVHPDDLNEMPDAAQMILHALIAGQRLQEDPAKILFNAFTHVLQNKIERTLIPATEESPDAEYECHICMETFKEVFTPACGHKVCLNCVNQQDRIMFREQRNTTCSFCRSVIVQRE